MGNDSTNLLATFERDLPDWQGDARLYKLSRAVRVDGLDHPAEYVVVSAVVVVISGPETYVFPASSTGEVEDWGELDGSFRGDLDHEAALHGFLAAYCDNEGVQ